MELQRKRRRWPFILAALVLLGTMVLADGQRRLVTDEYTVCSGDLPQAFDGFRIVQLSDLHGAVFGRDNERLLAAVERARPDIIALTGDLIDQTEDMPVIEALLPCLTAIAPCYYVTGNHEWAVGNTAELKALLAGSGVTVLENECRLLERDGETMLLGGVEDPNSWADMIQPDAFVQTVRQTYPDSWFLLLGHRNYWAAQYPALDVNAILCGHAHGGLFRLPGIGGLIGTDRLLFPENTEGAIDCGRYTMVVSRGLGNVPGTLRLFNNPEIVVVILEKI